MALCFEFPKKKLLLERMRHLLPSPMCPCLPFTPKVRAEIVQITINCDVTVASFAA
jgi:hypothetical protein